MATTAEIQNALADEARRNVLRQKIAKLQGGADSTATLIQTINSLNSDNMRSLANAQAQLASLEVGAGAGVTSDFGQKSTVTQFIEAERFAAKDASIDYIKANPSCEEADVAKVWNDAALASHPSFQFVVQDGLVMSKMYRANLLAMGAIAADTWEAHRQFILNTDKATIQSL